MKMDAIPTTQNGVTNHATPIFVISSKDYNNNSNIST
jgi:hypothetical protein